jgi:hypothetical protein
LAFSPEEGWTFEDVTEKAGLQGVGYGLGVAAGDYDNDGFEDLYVTGYGGNRLYHAELKNTAHRLVSAVEAKPKLAPSTRFHSQRSFLLIRYSDLRSCESETVFTKTTSVPVNVGILRDNIKVVSFFAEQFFAKTTCNVRPSLRRPMSASSPRNSLKVSFSLPRS